MSELRVVPFRGQTAATESLLDSLGAIEREVRQGEIEAFVVVGVKRNGDIFGGRSEINGAAHFALLGGLHQQTHELAQIITENAIITLPPEPEAEP